MGRFVRANKKYWFGIIFHFVKCESSCLYYKCNATYYLCNAFIFLIKSPQFDLSSFVASLSIYSTSRGIKLRHSMLMCKSAPMDEFDVCADKAGCFYFY